MDGSTANFRFRVSRTVKEESPLVSETRPSSTKYKDKWAVSDLDVENVFKDYGFHLACSVEGNLEDMDAL